MVVAPNGGNVLADDCQVRDLAILTFSPLIHSSTEKAYSAKFVGTEFYEVRLRDAERRSVRRVMSSSCSQPSPTKE